jgi:alpha-glucoside transport system ATP-binding protein
MNIVPATIVETGAATRVKLAGDRVVSLPIETSAGEVENKASFGVRPEDLTVATGDDYLFEGTISLVEALGEVTLLYVDNPAVKEPLIAKLPGIVGLKKGDRVRLSADPAKLHLFDAEGNAYRR